MADGNDGQDSDVTEVEARLREIRRRKQVRWTMSPETAEMAIAALAMRPEEGEARKPSPKSRRRKRGKRLL